ncbi:DNA mismatch repair protein MutS [Borrelia hermsii]|uniref:DNA mismatch repair protein MutS n=3 Tax=Borrelia hermsii TaxID=140 RepID=MUTS_BORHD|nr:DNA mismatch repair protein MutS [Borrelia hermsii]B2S1E1.1 RecName: Full=DNA mismatch repair protein MutS [Borrelia hermsii DAH]AAX17294.1 DNA mismatch repair protein MutS [Borrelia hermsii DAH]AJW73576.1 DNA mismatch repair protein MutS [Borrelia hermsii CC1]AMR75070.1 DNA mismatch repair protein mutS / MMR [Borrelia hermsii]ANA43597.1 DNA mismatch repair protein MutS [Borrelia hermsii HS1]UCP01790.1 DNA mismatch repair protein MutS [Borrelia hermsii]
MKKDVTPMMRQYLSIKNKHKDAILFFRVGSFYEMFFDDALEGSKLLGLTLTKREDIPMCGVPCHTSKEYIKKLILLDRKVAICEQGGVQTDPKGPLEREVVEVISPGVVVDEDFLQDDVNNYLVAISDYKDYYSFSYIDLSTSRLGIILYEGSFLEKLRRDIEKYSPKEIIVSESFYYKYLEKLALDRFLVNKVPHWHLDKDIAIKSLKDHFNVLSLSAFGFKEDEPYYISSFLIIDYIKNNLKNLLINIDTIYINSDSEYMFLDDVTQINLELVKNNNDLTARYSLYSVLNDCKTPMGKRLLREYILNPLLDIAAINNRLDHVEFLNNNVNLSIKLREILSNVWDIERIISRLQMRKYAKKDFLFIRETLIAFFSVKRLLNEYSFNYWIFDVNDEGDIRGIYSLIDCAISNEQDELIKQGYNSEIDRLRELKNNASKYVDDYLDFERNFSKINSLKIKRINVRGLFFEVTKSYYGQVPSHFIESQTLNSVKRYKTNKLIELERDINDAEDNLLSLEQEIFDEIALKVVKYSTVIKKVAEFCAYIDVVSNFAYLAKKNEYVRPTLTNNKEIILECARHPVVEHYMKGVEAFTRNSVRIDGEKYFCLITGPNMAGKSTYLRQTALVVLMGHIGSFVPANKAIIGITDKIFCRIGASDNISKGESTFLVEMNETANILRNATQDSLIIMDEVGRGTSTNDGLAIACSIVEYILEDIKARSLFATHFHELSAINHDSFVNLSMKIERQGNELIFLREVEEKPSLNSYGIYVARIAGIPLKVIKRANIILKSLTSRENLCVSEFFTSATSVVNDGEDTMEEDLSYELDLNAYLELKNLISKIDINNITPFQAMNLLSEIILKTKM